MRKSNQSDNRIHQNEQLSADLRLAEARTAMLAAIVDSSEDAIISKNLQGIITSWNLAAERIFGYNAVEMINEPILKLIPEDRFEEESVILSRMRAGERIEHFETKRLSKRGILIDVSLTISPIRSFSGEIIGVSKIARDITNTKLVDQKSAILAAIVESTDDAIISKNFQGIVTSWNPAAERIFGYKAAEMINEPIIKLIPEDRLQEETVILSRMHAGERIEHFETKRRAKSGTLVDVSLTISPIRSYSGEIIGISKIARDITKMKLAEEESAILAAIVESTDDAIFSKDSKGIITSWNNSAERIFGYSAHEMIGQSISKLIPPDRQKEEILILKQLENGLRVDNFETKRLTKYGKLIDVSVCLSPIRNKTGEIIGLSRIARDITDKKLEEQRKNDFISIVSHELKTPLTTIKSYVQLALNKAKESNDKFTENILNRTELQTNKMIKMIHDFLNLSRLEDGKMMLNLSRFSLPELMDEVVSEGSVIAPNHLVLYHGCSDVEIVADRDKIGQVMTNLLGNAVKYSQPGTTISISCEIENGQVEISVADQGIGISPHDQKRLFDRFYRVKDEQVTKMMGFGIGLYLVSEILRLHESVIKVNSEPGNGSTFSFSLSI